ncbi:MAG: hypothetical protein AAGA08_16955 [Pseudomonadota bacterium]
MNRTPTQKQERIRSLYRDGYTVQQIEYITRYDRSDIRAAVTNTDRRAG